MLAKGVYTVECPKCKSSTIIHLESDGSFNPHKCSKCELEFSGIGNGERSNSYVGLVKDAEEASKTDKKPFEAFSLTKKSSKKNDEGKKIENSFKWQ